MFFSLPTLPIRLPNSKSVNLSVFFSGFTTKRLSAGKFTPSSNVDVQNNVVITPCSKRVSISFLTNSDNVP